jgi:multiple sugar transport system ATP-binding protein
MAKLQFNNINKIYPNGVQAVFDFNMEINDGEFIVFVGPSGCGKSTTLRMVAGLEEISSGSLILDDAVINDVAPKDRDIAMVFQNYALYSHMTVYHNMAFSMVLRRENSDLIHERVIWAAKILGLMPVLNRKPSQLSGGQRQRVALGRAIVRNPKIFLLDEPLSNLDAKLRNSMRKELKELHHRLNTTMIYVTHDQIEALTLADRIVIMNNGYVQQIGTPMEIYDNPKNLFVANFIGTPPMNFATVSLSQDGKLLLEDTEWDISDHPAYKTLKKYFGKEVVLGIRPEHIEIHSEGDLNPPLKTKVDIYELLGAEAMIHFQLFNKSLIAKIHDIDAVKAHEEMNVYFPVEKIYFFDKDSEERIYG